MKGLRDTVLDAGNAGAEIKPAKELKYLGDTLQRLRRAKVHYETKSGTRESEPVLLHVYADRMTDGIKKICAAVVLKLGSTGPGHG